MSVGSYNPDEEEGAVSRKRPKWMSGTTELQVALLKACRRTYFKDKTEKKRWDSIETKCIGANDEDYLHLCWVKNGISYWAQLNSKAPTRNLPNLLSYLLNDDKRIDWTAKNREQLLKSRGAVTKSDLEDAILQNNK